MRIFIKNVAKERIRTIYSALEQINTMNKFKSGKNIPNYKEYKDELKRVVLELNESKNGGMISQKIDKELVQLKERISGDAPLKFANEYDLLRNNPDLFDEIDESFSRKSRTSISDQEEDSDTESVSGKKFSSDSDDSESKGESYIRQKKTF